MRQLETSDRGFRRKLNRAIRIESLLNQGLRGRAAVGVAGDAGDDPISVSRTVQICRSHAATELQASICRCNPRTLAVDFHRAQKRVDTAAGNFLHFAEPAIAGIAAHSYTSAVAVHEPTHFTRRNEYAVSHAFDTQEPVASAMRADGSFDDVAGPYCECVWARRRTLATGTSRRGVGSV